MWKINLRKNSNNIFAEPNATPLWGLPSLMLRSFTRRICGSLSLAQICSASALQTSHIPGTLGDISLGGLKYNGGVKNDSSQL